ncbi:hypothetical protein X975_02843, partial [Stegodyphus mimosarum]
MPRFNPKEDEISLFLVLFECQAKIRNLPAETQVSRLISLLPPDIVQLIAREREEDTKKYEYVKTLLLQRFKLIAEKFRQLFNKHQKSIESIWYDFYYELKNYLEGWLNELNIKTFEQLKDLMLVDQIKKRTSPDFKEHFMDFMDEWTTIISHAEMVKKIEDFEDVRKTIKPKFSANQTERINKGSFKARYDNFGKKRKHPPYFKHSDKWDDSKYQKDHRQRSQFQNKNQENKDIGHVVSSCSPPMDSVFDYASTSSPVPSSPKSKDVFDSLLTADQITSDKRTHEGASKAKKMRSESKHESENLAKRCKHYKGY